MKVLLDPYTSGHLNKYYCGTDNDIGVKFLNIRHKILSYVAFLLLQSKLQSNLDISNKDTSKYPFKGRFLEFRRYHNFVNLFSKLSESTFYREIIKFQ